MKRKTLDAASLRRFAVAAEVDPATITKALNGEPIRGMPGDRARRVLREAGKIPKEENDGER